MSFGLVVASLLGSAGLISRIKVDTWNSTGAKHMHG